MPTRSRSARSKWLQSLFISAATLGVSGSVLAASEPCFEVQLMWAVPGRIPMNDAPFAVYGSDKEVIYRGRADKDGVAHICVARLPTDATILAIPDEPGGSPPSRIFPPESQR
jgi:hypothetical protein